MFPFLFFTKKNLFLILLFHFIEFGQTEYKNKQTEINTLISTFMDYLPNKDSAIFYSLFYTGHVVWVRVFKEKLHLDRLKKEPSKKSHFYGTYKKFYRYIYNGI